MVLHCHHREEITPVNFLGVEQVTRKEKNPNAGIHTASLQPNTIFDEHLSMHPAVLCLGDAPEDIGSKLFSVVACLAE